MRIGAVLFDVDGTLVDSNDLHAEAWRETFLHFGIDLPREEIRAQIGKGGDNLLPTLLPRDLLARSQQDIEDYRSELFKRDFLERSQAFPSVCALFERLHGDGVKIVLASSARQDELDFHITRIGCGSFISATTSKDDVEHSKPCPDIFEAAYAKVAPLPKGEVLVIGDTPWDLKAAARAGLAAIAVRSGGFADSELEGAAAIFDGPEDLLVRYGEWAGIAAPAA